MPAMRYFPASVSELMEPPGEMPTEEEPSGRQDGSHCSSPWVCFQVVGTALSPFLLLSHRVGLRESCSMMGIPDERQGERGDLEENHLPCFSVLSFLCCPVLCE